MDSPLGLLLRAKYFHSCTFWYADSKGRYSFFWSSILKVKVILKEGIRWQIGNGLTVSFWHDIWEKDLPLASFLSLDSPFDFNLKVDLINLGTDQWDVSCVAGFLPSYILSLIKSIHVITCPSIPDRMVWHASKSGLPTVKSIYSHLNDNVSSFDPLWKKLWHFPCSQTILMAVSTQKAPR